MVDSDGRDVTKHFVRGAEEAAEAARMHGIRVAILKEGSPSCGTSFIYDGTFSGTRVVAPGVTAARLRELGVAVFSENQIAQAEALLRSIEGAP